MLHTTPLKCDICGQQFGTMYEFDINGSYFFCDNCCLKADFWLEKEWAARKKLVEELEDRKLHPEKYPPVRTIVYINKDRRCK